VSLFNISHYRFHHRGGEYETVKIRCAPTTVEHVVPPAGEDHAWDFQHYRRTVEVTVSPTGRSVQVYVDGKRVA